MPPLWSVMPTVTPPCPGYWLQGGVQDTGTGLHMLSEGGGRLLRGGVPSPAGSRRVPGRRPREADFWLDLRADGLTRAVPRGGSCSWGGGGRLHLPRPQRAASWQMEPSDPEVEGPEGPTDTRVSSGLGASKSFAL